MRRNPEAAVERAMKVQEVFLQAMAKKITWWRAAEILGVTDRTMRRWRWQYVQGNGQAGADWDGGRWCDDDGIRYYHAASEDVRTEWSPF